MFAKGNADRARLRDHLRLLGNNSASELVHLSGIRESLKKLTPVRRLRTGLRMLRARGQSNENEIIERLAIDCPKTFIEFGFHPAEFNCSALAKRADWKGMLIDGDAGQVADAKFFLPSRIEAVQRFLTLDRLSQECLSCTRRSIHRR